MTWSLYGTSGTETFGLAVSDNPGTAWQIVGSGDFDRSGFSDLLWQHADGSMALWRFGSRSVGNTDGKRPTDFLAGPGSYWTVAGTGDFDADGRSDILWRGEGHEVAVWFMNGKDATGGGLVADNPGAFWSIAGTGDFNADGRSDVLWHGQDGSLAIWEMNGTAKLRESQFVGNAGLFWTVAGTGDFNRDGYTDVLWRGADGSVVIWNLQGGSVVGGGYTSFANPGLFYAVADVDDFNGDFASDILWRGQDGSVVIWYMDNTTSFGGGQIGNPGDYWSVIAV